MSADKVMNVWEVVSHQLLTTIPVFEHIYDAVVMNSATFRKITGKPTKPVDDEEGLSTVCSLSPILPFLQNQSLFKSIF